LEAVHLAGVVHRDLKPSNVMVTPRGPVLIDFGIAVAPEDETTEGLTQHGFVIGTPGYIAPELFDGGDPTPESDWWSWAALLAFAATGRTPFGVRPVDLVLRRSREGRADLVGLPARTARAIAAALQSEPTDRWGPPMVVRALRRDCQEMQIAAGYTVLPDDADEAAPKDEAVADGDATTTIAESTEKDNAEATVASGADAQDTESAEEAGADSDLGENSETSDTEDTDDDAASPEVSSPATTEPDVKPEASATEGGDEPETTGRDGDTTLLPAGTTQEAWMPPGADPTMMVPAATGSIPLGEVRFQPYSAMTADSEGVASHDDESTAEMEAAAPYRRPTPKRRVGTVLAALVPLLVLAATRPGWAVGILVALIVACRIVGHSWQAYWDRREKYGQARRSDVPIALAKVPLHIPLGFVTALPQVLVAGLVGFGAWWGGYQLFIYGDADEVIPEVDADATEALVESAGLEPYLPFLVLAVAFLAFALVAWFGPAAKTARIGARVGLRVLAFNPVITAALVSAALVAGWILARPLLVDEEPEIHWWPLPNLMSDSADLEEDVDE